MLTTKKVCPDSIKFCFLGSIFSGTYLYLYILGVKYGVVMFKILFEGILLGITLALLIGPSFFALIQTSISKGFKSGLALAFGIFLSDLLFIILSYLGASQLLHTSNNKLIIGVIGGIALIGFGTFNILQKKQIEERKVEIIYRNLPLTVMKGFFLNVLNPFVFVFWLGAVTVITSKDNFSFPYFILFISGTLITVFVTDILKSLIALKIKKTINPEMLILLNRLAGVALIIFGIILIYRVVN